MDASEYQMILEYLRTKEIPVDIKKDRYKKKNFVRKCKGICVHDQKLMKVTINFRFMYIGSFILYSTLEPEEEERNLEIPRDSHQH